MHQLRFRFAITLLFSLCLALPALARVVSYAPYTNRPAIPAIQNRLNRHFVLYEVATSATNPFFLPYSTPRGQVVVYDSASVDEPRVVFPPNGEEASVFELASRQTPGQQPVILLRTDHNYLGTNPGHAAIFLISPDGGTTWKRVDLPAGAGIDSWLNPSSDTGGPIVRGRHSQIRIGTDDYPFVVGFSGSTGVFSVTRDGFTDQIASPTSDVNTPLLGSSVNGDHMIVRVERDKIAVVQTAPYVILVPPPQPFLIAEPDFPEYEGWITPNGDVYLEAIGARLYIYRNRVPEKLVEVCCYGSILTTPPVPSERFFAVPTADYSGAWFIRIDPASSGGSNLWLHKDRTLTKQWTDITRPDIEALHAGASGRTLLIQVHRPRSMADQRLFLDPALAVWHVGDPAPKAYDELFMNEQYTKGFVHVDVDKLEEGEPFVFDSGAIIPSGGVIISPPPPNAGGGDVIQEWGVVRASLKQKLVLPGIGRIRGGYESNWVSDVILQNPLDTPQRVVIRFAENGTAAVGASIFNSTTIVLQPHEIRVVRDALKELFALESGNGALFLTPEAGINANSRTYNKTSTGTYGYNLNAIDIYSAASPRFPVSFSGAFPGNNFRTNVVITDASTAGTQAQLTANGTSGSIGAAGVMFDAPAGGQIQANNVGATLRLESHDSGALLVAPRRGFAIASVFAIDNRTNDPTYFPPDLPAPIVRTIPVIGHIAGANNSEFRSDLYLFNPAATTNTVTLQVKSWDSPETPVTLTLTLLPREGRVIRDVLKTAFNKTGLARLRYTSQTNAVEGVRVTSRTYTVNLETGGTFGFLMPPLNNFQHAGPGDSLEILGTVHDASFRTNLGIVDLSAFANPSVPQTKVRVEIVGSGYRVIDQFEVNVPSAGGVQLNDLFRSRGLAVNGNAYLLRVSPVNGLVGAFASFIDNDTNDPSYIAANLSAQQ